MSGNARRGRLSRVVALVLPLLAAAPSAAAPADGYVGAETCAACHEEVVSAFAGTPHATAKGWDAATGCESCHGPGAAHADSGDPADIRQLKSMPRRDSSAVCLECHANGQPSLRTGDGIHRQGDVGCVDCHSPHTTTRYMVPRDHLDLCRTCHQEVVAQFNLPIHHPLGTAGKGCATCHNPHGAGVSWTGNRGLSGGVCADCHRDKVGPFLFPHDVSIVDGCGACHRMHGSPNRHLLIASRQVTLCFQCHQAPGGPHNPASLVNQKCTTCHVDIHGSNTNSSFREN